MFPAVFYRPDILGIMEEPRPLVELSKHVFYQ